MYDALKKLFERNNTNKPLSLRHQLQNLKMTKSDTVSTFIDKLGAIGEIISDREIAMITLNGLPRYWEPFIQSIIG